MSVLTAMLLPYFLVFFAAAFVLPTWRVWRRDGTNALVLPRDNSAFGVIGVWFKILIGSILILCASVAFGVSLNAMGPLVWANHTWLHLLGAILLVVTLVWVVMAQANMGQSWRIGIDQKVSSKLVTLGLFARSRNPIFLGMRINMLGLFFILPNAPTLAILLASEILMGVQVRLEEAHLRETLGQPYLDYCTRVPRWL
jgi:protein-S-isoprenylcysteine O-methyltransferase Ste14